MKLLQILPCIPDKSFGGSATVPHLTASFRSCKFGFQTHNVKVLQALLHSFTLATRHTGFLSALKDPNQRLEGGKVLAIGNKFSENLVLPTGGLARAALPALCEAARLLRRRTLVIAHAKSWRVVSLTAAFVAWEALGLPFTRLDGEWPMAPPLPPPPLPFPPKPSSVPSCLHGFFPSHCRG